MVPHVTGPWIPAGLADGLYHVGLVLDTGNTVAEIIRQTGISLRASSFR